MLDIVITHYNEPWRLCRKLFVMLDMQRIVNWDEITVTVVNDGGDRLPEEELKRLTFPVEQIDIPKSGVSAARNKGIMNGKESWIMFCDCDDTFTNIYALDEIISAIRRPSNSQFDMMYANCWMEFGKLVVPIEEKRPFIFIHGKVYKREFLIKEGLKFDESISYGEDTQFNKILEEKTDKIAEIKSRVCPYVWIRRGGSVTTKGTV